jgi:hypothetical protein
MNPLSFRPLKEAQDFYRYVNQGSDWVNAGRATPRVGYHVYIVIFDQSEDFPALKTTNKIRAYLANDGWRYADGRLIEDKFVVGMWMYDETSRGCILV